MRLLSVMLLALVVAEAANADTPQSCASIQDDGKRLECFDINFRKAVTVTTASKWVVKEELSKIDDSTNVFMQVLSNEEIRGLFGVGAGHASLNFACRENETSMWVYFAGNFMADIEEYGRVTFRLDDEKAFNKRLSVSTNNEALGMWGGRTAIPFAKSLFQKNTLLVRAVPFNQSSVTVEFPIAGMSIAAEPLRRACGW